MLAANGHAGLLTCALRPHLIWGPRDPHLVPRLIDRARRGRLRQVGNGTNLIDMVYVENAAEAHLQAADALEDDSPVAGRAYFISQGEPVRCWDWINAILALAGLPPVQRRSRPPPPGGWAAVLGSGRIACCGSSASPLMTRFLAAQLATSHYFNIDRARRDFGYQPPSRPPRECGGLVSGWPHAVPLPHGDNTCGSASVHGRRASHSRHNT